METFFPDICTKKHSSFIPIPFQFHSNFHLNVLSKYLIYKSLLILAIQEFIPISFHSRKPFTKFSTFAAIHQGQIYFIKNLDNGEQ